MAGKTRLRRASWARVMDIILGAVAVFLFLFAGGLPDLLYALAILGCVLLLLLLGSLDRVCLTPDFLEKSSSKILYRDMDEVREFLWWYIVWDRYGDSMWVPVGLLGRDSRERLRKWLKGEGIEQGTAGE